MFTHEIVFPDHVQAWLILPRAVFSIKLLEGGRTTNPVAKLILVLATVYHTRRQENIHTTPHCPQP